jgi:hypothetical protein
MQFCNFLDLDYYSIIQSILFSSSLNVCSALMVKGQFSQECKVKLMLSL